MIKEVTILQEKRIKIYSPAWTASGHGYCDNIEGKLYFDEIYLNQIQANKLLKEAQKIYNDNNYKAIWMKEPQLEIYWKTLKKQEKRGN